jgi:hypothetical protein
MQSRPTKLAGLGSGGIILLLLGFCFLMLGRGQWVLASHASPEPQTLFLQDLIAKGPGDNRHVRVTQFTFGDGYVVEGLHGGWDEVWIPVYPASGTEVGDPGHPRADPFAVLIHTRKPRSKDELARYCDTTTVIQGVMLSDHGAPAGWSEIGGKLLAMYPGTDLENCRVIYEGDRPWSPSSVNAILVIGVALFGSGVALILVLVALIIRDRRAAAAARTSG